MEPLAIETPNMRALADDVHRRLTLESSRHRERGQREADADTWRKLCDLATANLAGAMLTGKGVPMYIKTRVQKIAMYLPAEFRSTLIRPLIMALGDSGLATIEISPPKPRKAWRERSYARGVHVAHPSEDFRALMLQHGVGVPDMRQAVPEEVISLKFHRSGEDGELRDFHDTAETRQLRRELQQINTRLAGASLYVQGMPHIPTWKRYIRRQFATFDARQRFDMHGRLYGGFWLNMEQHERAAIRIDGKPIADLDYKAMFLSLVYLRAGLPFPPGDPYACPPFEQQREGIKHVLNAMLNVPLRNWPKDTRSLFPHGARFMDVKAAILARHPVLCAPGVLRPWLGLELMYTESCILVAALLALDAQGITALPVHDGLMVAASRAGAAADAMSEASARIVGVRLPVVRKL